MYVCLCLGFTDKEVKNALAEGRRSLGEIYACLGGKPRCGKCVGEVLALMACAPAGAAEMGGAGPACAAPQAE